LRVGGTVQRRTTGDGGGGGHVGNAPFGDDSTALVRTNYTILYYNTA